MVGIVLLVYALLKLLVGTRGEVEVALPAGG